MTAKIRVIHVVPTLGAGGTEQNCARLAKAFADNGTFENHIVAMRPGDESFRLILQGQSPHPVKLLPSGRVAKFRTFLNYVGSVQPGVVLFHFFNIDQVLLVNVNGTPSTGVLFMAVIW